jgi:hypothetical protein
MNRAGKAVMEEFGDIVLGFGESDEYRYVAEETCIDMYLTFLSFLMRRQTNVYGRRRR